MTKEEYNEEIEKINVELEQYLLKYISKETTKDILTAKWFLREALNTWYKEVEKNIKKFTQTGAL